MTNNPTLPVIVDALNTGQQVAAQAEAQLRSSPYLPLRKLRCEYNEGVLTIRGQVPTFYLKQLAQTRIRQVPGVEEINNRVEVAWPRPTPVASARAAVALHLKSLHRVPSPLSRRRERRSTC